MIEDLVVATTKKYSKQVMTIADLRPFVIVEKQHVHFFDFGSFTNFVHFSHLLAQRSHKW